VNGEWFEGAGLGLQPKFGVGDFVDETRIAGVGLIAEKHLGMPTALGRRTNPDEQKVSLHHVGAGQYRQQGDDSATIEMHG
jgi:hypothetical protein